MKVAYKKQPKQKGVSLWWYLFAVIVTTLVVSFTKPQEKLYKFEATLPEFVKGDKWLNIAKQAILKSDLPSRDASMIIDSLSEYQNKIVAQINSQLEADKKLEKPPVKDSVSKKNN